MVSYDKPQLVIYFDGSCPLCRAEIRHYGTKDDAGMLSFVDASRCGENVAEDLPRHEAMSRFHVRRSDGTLVSGAAAFIAIWQVLPGWRLLAPVAALPGIRSVLELGYRVFLPVRPHLSRLIGALQRRKGGERAGSKTS